MATTAFPLDLHDPDSLAQPAVALLIESQQNDTEVPVHYHRKGQLIVALKGGNVCTIEDGLWMVPPGFGVWVPSGTVHSNRVTANGKICLLFIEPGIAQLPEHCCTLALSPLILELVLYLAGGPNDYPADGQIARLAGVLLELLEQAPAERFYLPLPKSPQVRQIASALAEAPASRVTVAEWADRVAMSERTLARLIKNETGLSFGHWRKQWQIIVALQHLVEGASVQSTAEALGYESVSSFISMFRKTLGNSPARYVRDAIVSRKLT
ncbi:helix-turn-helix domain-containing protein [Pseudomonas vranovensis]|uniref:AraC family transcriptional regulator n=1 Tax=Pseudomonas vranovensis TaxID=321661 RepID=A0A423D7L4_9PSED|nr:helix-turn-helix transcriptional regulator [Pseudomonas vranovensis]ROL67533.1 AraC family transcriptional regulator [Pseudomonas vranovensis]